MANYWLSILGNYSVPNTTLYFQSPGSVVDSLNNIYTIITSDGSQTYSINNGTYVIGGGIAKHDENGKFISRIDFYDTAAATTTFYVRSIAIDSSDNIYILAWDGNTNNTNSTSNSYLIKLNSSLQIQLQLKITGGFQAASTYDAIHIDSFGNIYIMGRFYYDTNIQYPGIIKYDSVGALSWASKIAIGNGTTTPSAITMDSQGNLYATFNWYDSSVSRYKALLVKVNGTNGNIIWSKIYDGTSNSYIYKVLIDSNDNVYVINVYTDSSYRTQVVKYNSTGTIIETFALNNSNGGSMWGYNMSLDETSQHIYLVGYSNSGLTSHGILCKIDMQSDTLVYSRQFGVPSSSNPSYIYHIKLDPNKDLILTGKVSITGNSNYAHNYGFIAKMPNNGTGTGTYGFTQYSGGTIQYGFGTVNGATISDTSLTATIVAPTTSYASCGRILYSSNTPIDWNMPS